MKQWWASITEREQRLVLGLLVVAVIGSLYWGVWQPISQRAERADMAVMNQRSQLNWVEQTANQIVSLRGQGESSQISEKGLSQVVNETAGGHRIKVIRMQPRSDALQVWIEPLPFDDLLTWLAHLREVHGVDTQFLDIARGQQSGVVDVNRLQLGRD
ncbi:type II secretion system protein M [Thaumasiovibrio sp. DFM-14]|uniref:type II secretion system protein M n=1 Tax=Thaumasiovibrio sp. DFM-14 TaxID=3384792 RepID=UPI0039A2D03A